MSKKPINQVLLVEDNPGDARLLREMFDEQGSHGTELTIVQSWVRPRDISPSMRSTLSCSTWDCPMHKDWMRCGGPTPPRPVFRWSC